MKTSRLALLTAAMALPVLALAQSNPQTPPAKPTHTRTHSGNPQAPQTPRTPPADVAANAEAQRTKMKALSDEERSAHMALAAKQRADMQAVYNDHTLTAPQRKAKLDAIRQSGQTQRKALSDKAMAARKAAMPAPTPAPKP